MSTYEYHSTIKKYARFLKMYRLHPLLRWNKAINWLGKLSQIGLMTRGISTKKAYIHEEKHWIPITLYESKIKVDKRPVLIYVHGGAFVLGDFRHMKKRAMIYAKKSNALVVFVSYRLLPKHPFPSAFEDVYHVYQWLFKQAKTLDIDPEKISFIGDSAGGLLVSTVVQRLMQEHHPVQSQLLIYPVLSIKQDTPSMKTFLDTAGWDAQSNAKMWAFYTGNYSKNTPYLSIENVSIKKIPPTYIEVSEYDCLKDEAINYFHVLQEVQTRTVLTEIKQAFHGFDTWNQKPLAKEAIEKRMAFYNDVLGDKRG